MSVEDLVLDLVDGETQPRGAPLFDSAGDSARDTAKLLDDVAAHIRRYCVLTVVQVYAVALWVLHTHAFDAAETTPYLSIGSAEKQSGKTRLLEILDGIVARPWFTGRTTAAVLPRKIDSDAPTLLLDESDAAFAGDKDFSQALRGILNSGYRRSGKTTMCVPKGKGFETRDFNTFCPKAIAGIGDLPDTVADRSIRIEMRRRSASEPVDKLRQRDVSPKAEALRERLAAWANSDTLSVLAKMLPVAPPGLGDRAEDCWEPLLAIADFAGGEWPVRAREAAASLSGLGAAEDQSRGIRLLTDIYTIFEESGDEWITSADLVLKLSAIEESPWGPDARGRPFDTHRLAALLRPFGIKPSQKWTGERNLRSYERAQFADAFARYVLIPGNER